MKKLDALAHIGLKSPQPTDKDASAGDILAGIILMANDLLVSSSPFSPFNRLQDETTKLFQSYHYNHYDHFLWLSDQLGQVYYEHHRCGENSRPGSFLQGKGPVPSLGFIEHGYVHSGMGCIGVHQK